MAAILPINALHEEELPTSSEGADKTTTDPQESEPSEKPEADVLPDGGYGWVCVACNFWINAHTWGVNSVCGRMPSSFSHMQTV